MLQFPDWFKQRYKRWRDSQPGEEDFLGFCSLLGYAPATAMSWLEGERLPEEAELLSIAGALGIEVYEVLGEPAPDPGLMEIFEKFSHLRGEARSRLSLALWEVGKDLQQRNILVDSAEGKMILDKAFDRWRIG